MLVGYSCPIQAVGHALQNSQWFIPPLASPLSRRNERCSSRTACTTPSSYIPAALPGLEKSAHTLGTRTEDARVSVAPDRREIQSACHTPGIRSYVLGDVYQRRVTKMKGNKLGHTESNGVGTLSETLLAIVVPAWTCSVAGHRKGDNSSEPVLKRILQPSSSPLGRRRHQPRPLSRFDGLPFPLLGQLRTQNGRACSCVQEWRVENREREG